MGEDLFGLGISSLVKGCIATLVLEGDRNELLRGQELFVFVLLHALLLTCSKDGAHASSFWLWDLNDFFGG